MLAIDLGTVNRTSDVIDSRCFGRVARGNNPGVLQSLYDARVADERCVHAFRVRTIQTVDGFATKATSDDFAAD